MQGKKLYKSDTNKKVAGVCGGLADYFGISSTIVRVFWFLITWFWGTGFIIYIALAIILPSESDVMAKMRESSTVTIDPEDQTIYDDEPEIIASEFDHSAEQAVESSVIDFEMDNPVE
jgi:phage shock protein PspC (stress-responsive transcriptional regulator)